MKKKVNLMTGGDKKLNQLPLPLERLVVLQSQAGLPRFIVSVVSARGPEIV